MTMDEYERKFLELLRYVELIKDEKVNIQMFLSGIPNFYKDKIQHDVTMSSKNVVKSASFQTTCHKKLNGEERFDTTYHDRDNDYITLIPHVMTLESPTIFVNFCATPSHATLACNKPSELVTLNYLEADYTFTHGQP